MQAELEGLRHDGCAVAARRSSARDGLEAEVLRAGLKGLGHDSVALHNKEDVKELLAARGLMRDSVGLHLKDVSALQTEQLALRDDVGALGEMDLKSVQEEAPIMQA